MSNERLSAAVGRAEQALDRLRRALARTDREREREMLLRHQVEGIAAELDALIAREPA